jgi:hypothetical protein
MRKYGFIALIVFATLGVIALALAENNTLGTGAGSMLGIYSHSNTYLGEAAGLADTSGVGNTGIGYGAGYMNRSGAGNIYLGYMAGYTNSSSYKLFIQHYRYPTYGIFGTLSSGYFGINNSSPAVALDVTGGVTVSDTLKTAYLFVGNRKVAFTQNVSKSASESVSVAVTLLDATDIISCNVYRRVIADSALVIRAAIPGTNTVKIHFSKVPADSIGISIISWHD